MTSTSANGADLGSSTHSGDRSRASLSNAPSPTAVSSDLTPAPEADSEHAATEPASASHPDVDHNNHNDDNHNANNNYNVDDGFDASAGYGTRSRNRPRGARPNYADDKEIDLEIEAAGKLPKATKKSAASITATANTAAAATAPSVAPTQPQTMPAQNTRNSFASVNGTSAANSSLSTGAVNGANGDTQPALSASKKRKQPGSSATSQATASVAEPRVSAAHRANFVASNMMSFNKCRRRPNKHAQLVADDGTTVQVNDHFYFLCEPPGEPYYFGRVMEFLHVDNDTSNPVEALRVNWFYRPKDINRRVQDTRVVFASMHSDICPLSQLRGKCIIKHLNDIVDLEEFRRQPDSFWFDKLFDRYMHRYYEVIPTSKVINVPPHVKKVLDERWKFVLYEIGRGKELTSASKVCKRCQNFANNTNSVDCAHCKNTYHMQCVRPPLLKKPARGFAWSCAACARAQELRMEARHTPMSENELSRLAEAESFDDDEDDILPADGTRENSIGPEQRVEPTKEQLAHANLWLWRYLGIHSKPEDALDYDDRIYPRATSRQGPRHQANVTAWHGRPTEFIKPAEAKKKYKNVSTKKDGKSGSLQDNDKRPKQPKWVVNEPPGYVARGEDEPVEIKNKKEYTAQLIFKMPDPVSSTRGMDEDDDRPQDYDEMVDQYLERCDREIAPLFNLGPGNVDIRTKGLEKLREHKYDANKAIESMKKVSAKGDLKLPELTKDEVRKFEEGVALFGSELHSVARYISPTIKEGRIVRFYYTWKKTPRGREIWGNFENRKSKKDSKRVEKDTTGAKLVDDVGDDADDSAFDEDKASRVKRGFKCRECGITNSRVWRRAPQTAPGTLVPRDDKSRNAKDKSNWLILALCGKCTYLWRRYAVKYESIGDLANKISIAGGRASKRKVDEELMRIVVEAHNFAGDTITKEAAKAAASAGIEVPSDMVESDEPPKKKPKAEPVPAPVPEMVPEKKKVVPEKPVELEPLKPEMPKVKEHPCAICRVLAHPDYRMLKCRDCRLHVHAPCYGVAAPVDGGPWYCDMCMNDHNTQVSTNYECALCPVRRTPQELMEPPKVSHKKKTDRERDKERAEREMVQEAGRRWREDQLTAGRPVDPREPLKRTAWNNWVHVNCAVWTKEIKFGDAQHLDAAEGIGFIPLDRFHTPCKFCTDKNYPTVTCAFQGCGANFHVGCAQQKGLTFGFDVSPVKVSRRDSVAVIKLDQESGLAVPGIWCGHHSVTTTIHSMLENTPSGATALQEYARTYKQVDNSVTGTVRRAAQFHIGGQVGLINGSNGAPRRGQQVNGPGGNVIAGDTGTNTPVRSPSPMSPQVNGNGFSGLPRHPELDKKAAKKCCTCSVEHTPKWWSVANAGRHTNKAGDMQQMNGAMGPNDSTPLRPGSNGPLPSPEMRHVQAGSGLSAQGTAMGQVKPEPMDIDHIVTSETVLYQCHKCHAQKKTPPSSPSQVRHRTFPPPLAEPAPPPVYPPNTGPGGLSHDPPPPHAGLHPGGPPPSSLYPGRPAHWSEPINNGGPRAGPHGIYGTPPAPYARAEFRYPYPAHPIHYAVPSGLPHPPPPPPPPASTNGHPAHSPPPGGYAHLSHSLSGQPGPGPPPPPAATTVPQPPSPHLGYGPRYSSYGVPPPPTLPRPGVNGGPEPPNLSRRPSESNMGGVGPVPGRVGLAGSPRLHLLPPAKDGPTREEPREHNRRDSVVGLGVGSSSTNPGPGASASPSLRNLLS